MTRMLSAEVMCDLMCFMLPATCVFAVCLADSTTAFRRTVYTFLSVIVVVLLFAGTPTRGDGDDGYAGDLGGALFSVSSIQDKLETVSRWETSQAVPLVYGLLDFWCVNVVLISAFYTAHRCASDAKAAIVCTLFVALMFSFAKMTADALEDAYTSDFVRNNVVGSLTCDAGFVTRTVREYMLPTELSDMCVSDEAWVHSLIQRAIHRLPGLAIGVAVVTITTKSMWNAV